MAEVIAITNQKGGVGKTTSSAGIGANLALRNYKVLLIEIDPQGNLSRGLGITDPPQTIYGTLLEQHPLIPYQIKENLSIVPATETLSAFPLVKGNEIDKEFILKEVIQPIKKICDYIILDTPPSLGLLTINALAACDKVLIPLNAQLFSLDGLEKAEKTIEKIKKRVNPGLKIEGLFFTMHDERKVLKRDTAAMLKEKYGRLIFNTAIRENISLQEAPHFGQDIYSYNPRCHGAEDYNSLVEELLNRSGKSPRQKSVLSSNTK